MGEAGRFVMRDIDELARRRSGDSLVRDMYPSILARTSWPETPPLPTEDIAVFTL